MKVGDIVSDYETGAEHLATEEDVLWDKMLNHRETPFPHKVMFYSIPTSGDSIFKKLWENRKVDTNEGI